MSGLKTLITGKSGSSKRFKKVRPSNFTSPGLSGTFDKKSKTFSVTRSSELSQNLEALKTRLGERSAEFKNLRSKVGGAFSDVIRGRVDAIRQAGSRTVGNLREELAKRRVLGSTFAQREIAGIEASFAEQEARERSEGALAQLGAEAELINQEFQGGIQSAMAMINQLNLEGSLAANLGVSAQNLMLARAEGQAQADQFGEGAQIDMIGSIVGFGMGGGFSSPETAGS